MKRKSLQIKIISNNIIALMLIGSLMIILFYEHFRIKEIETDFIKVSLLQEKVNTVHNLVTGLSLQGESAFDWNEDDLQNYHQQRMKADSLLAVLCLASEDSAGNSLIAIFRKLLQQKEQLLESLMKSCTTLKKNDSLLAQRLPIAAKEATRSQIIRQKKKGVAGLFGAKETIIVSPSRKRLENLEKELESHLEYSEALRLHVDSLQEIKNVLNRRFVVLISSLHDYAEAAFKEKEVNMTEEHDRSLRLMTIVSAAAILLLAVCYLFIHRDLKQRFANRRRLEQMHEEQKEQLRISNQINRTVSHDIRGPLGNISNCARLAGSERNKKKRDEYLYNIQDACRHILHLVNNLLDLHYIDEAEENLNKVPFSLSAFLERVAQAANLRATDKGLLFKKEYVGTNVFVKGDMDRLEQILDNLLSNAVKFTNDGNISFRAQYDNNKLSVEIQDSGIGMDGETLERIFKPFERAAQQMDSSGFGLGLSITQGLVRAFGGNITVNSKPGKGSIFRFTIPLPETTETSDSEKETSHCCSISNLPRKIVVIDDDTLHLKLVREMLERNGVYCHICTNTKELTSAFRTSDYDLVLTDIQMNGTDGFGVLEFLRNTNIGNSRTVPVAVMTAQGNGNPDVYVQAGFTDSLYKPFTEHRLLVFLSSLVKDKSIEYIDFSPITDGMKDRIDILKTFIKEMEVSRKMLEKATGIMKYMEINKVIHHMIPVWKMLHMEDSLYACRKILEEGNPEALKECIRQIVCQINQMIKAAHLEIKRMSYEKEEDTDC